MIEEYFIGCDVGTGSARAGVFDKSGTMLASASSPIQMWKPQPDYVEQSSQNIWEACCKVVRESVQLAGIAPESVRGIGFDATCSLVILGEHDTPLPASPGSDPEQNIIVWMDHRAKKEAEHINQIRHRVLDYVGGVISPEMQTPKLLWLKRHHPQTWRQARKFFDLSDYLVYKATGEDVRSECTTTCKWTYLAHADSSSKNGKGKWDDSFFREIDLGDLVDDQYRKIGQHIKPVGQPVGSGLTKVSAHEMGLKQGTAVGVAIIDAHAGGLGLLGIDSQNQAVSDFKEDGNPGEHRCMALIGGTSSCHMAVSKDPVFVQGIWGPYYSAMIPGLWLNEGGQSATGALIDHVIFSSHLASGLQEQAARDKCTVYDILNRELKEKAEHRGFSSPGLLTKELHVLPYFHGNRSPRANPSLKGSVCGLRLSSTITDLALLYLAVIQAIAYGTRHIIETLNGKGYAIDRIAATGGGTKNEVFLQQHADICGCPIILPQESEAVLLGSAVLGAVAAGSYPSVIAAMSGMNHAGQVIGPDPDRPAEYHEAKYEVFQKMYHDERSYHQIMDRLDSTST